MPPTLPGTSELTATRTCEEAPTEAALQPVTVLCHSAGGPDPSGHIGMTGDEVAVERPLEVRVQGALLCVTMRTPGHDAELARGLVLGARVVAHASIRSIERCAQLFDAPRYHDVIDVRLHPGATVDPAAFRRLGQVSSSCGVCGTQQLQRLVDGVPAVGPGPRWSPALLATLPARLAPHQRLFAATGGTHAAALFDATGRLCVLREDVGRHNAVDKVLGHAAGAGRSDLRDHALCVSGRVSFDIAQKALLAGVPVIVAVSAPSSLAVTLCAQGGILLAAFARDGRLPVYTHPERLEPT